jgi:hypothetical protein
MVFQDGDTCVVTAFQLMSLGHRNALLDTNASSRHCSVTDNRNASVALPWPVGFRACKRYMYRAHVPHFALHNGGFGGLRRESLLEIAAYGPLAGGAASLAAVVVGMGLSAAGIGGIDFQVVAFRDSFIVGLLGVCSCSLHDAEGSIM